jgi:hypothetical protein
VITEDSDVILYGCPAVRSSPKLWFCASRFTTLTLKNRFFLLPGMHVLAGCEFLPSVPGLYILDAVVDGTICFYQGLMVPKITLWNVTTKEFKVLPPSPLPSYDRAVFSPHGFGYYHVRNDLKVIRHAAHCMPLTDFESYIPPHDSMWEVYSLRSNSWEKLDVDIPTGYHRSGIGIHTNGVCHWWDGLDDCMVSFDLSS